MSNEDSISTPVTKAFSEPIVNMTDVILVVENQKMYASKKILAQFSPYFYDLFYGDGANEDRQEYEIKDTTYYSFKLFLRLLYCWNVKITIGNFKSLAELSFRFKVEHCLEECERFLIKRDMPPALKLTYAQEFNFEVLRDYVLRKKKFEEIWLKKGEPQTKTVLGVTVEWSIPKKGDTANTMDLNIECKWRDNLNAEDRKLDLVRIYDGRMLHLERKTLCRSDSTWDGPVDSKKDFAVRIRIYPVYGIHEPRSSSFQERRPNLTDVVLSVADKKFNVSKQILASQSLYFKTLFFSDSNNEGKYEFEIKGIEPNEFETFLQFIYHPSRLIKPGQIDLLLKLSQMYGVQSILRKCETFLRRDDPVNYAQKIKLAEKYNITPLFEYLISRIRSRQTFSEISYFGSGFWDLKDDTIGKIARNVLRNKR